MASTFKDIMDAVKTKIATLNLSGIGAGEIKVRRLNNDGEVYFPGITIHPVEEIYDTGTTLREDVGYGCQISMVKNNDNASDLNLDRLLQWRESIRKDFVEDPTLGSVSDVYRIMVEHGRVIDWNELVLKNYDISTMIIRVWCRETRT